MAAMVETRKVQRQLIHVMGQPLRTPKCGWRQHMAAMSLEPAKDVVRQEAEEVHRRTWTRS